MDCSMIGLPVHCEFLNFTQTHIHWVSDAIQLSHPLSSPSPLAFNLSHQQCLFQWVSSLHQLAKILELQLQHQSFQLILRTEVFFFCFFFFWWTDWICLSSPTPQFKSINSSALSFLHSPTLTAIHDYWKTIALTRQNFVGKVMSLLLNILSRLVIAFLSKSKRLLISWLQSPSAVILEPRKI